MRFELFYVCSLLIFGAPLLEDQYPGVVAKKLLFSQVISKTELVASKVVTANNYLPSSKRFIVGLNEKVFVAWVSLNSGVSCGVVFVCSIGLFSI